MRLSTINVNIVRMQLENVCRLVAAQANAIQIDFQFLKQLSTTQLVWGQRDDKRFIYIYFSKTHSD